MTTPGNKTSDHSTVDRAMARDEQIARRARELYREAGQHIDPVTAGRLRAARRQALEAARMPQRHTARWLVPTGAFAAIAFAMLMVWQPLSNRATVPTSQTSSVDQSVAVDNDLPPDAEKADPNLYQNLDFYDWLAANSESDSAPVNR
jgi:hypothetical protein